jgi:hypothetical protein
MMWNKVFEINDVNYSIYFYQDELVYLDRSGYLTVRSLYDYSLSDHVECGQDGLIYLIDGELYVRLPKKILTYKNHKLSSWFESTCDTVVPVNRHYVTVASDSDTSRSDKMYDVESGKMLWENETSNSFFTSMASDSHYFFKDIIFQILYRLDILTGDIIWKVEFPQGQRMENCPIYVYDNIAVVHNEGGYLRGLDLETGETCWEIDNCASYHSRHEETGHLHGITKINKAAYEVIDPIAGQRIVDVDLTEVFESKEVIAVIDHMHTLTKNSLFFQARCKGDSSKTHFGEVNLQTSTVEYIDSVEGDSYSVSKPYYKDGRIYFIQDNQILRVFERA